jgi:hypothetical protein
MKKKLILLAFSSMVAFIGVESILRLAGYAPGQLRSQWFHRVDKVELVDGFTTDEYGIFKVDTVIASRTRDKFKLKFKSDSTYYINYEEENTTGEVGVVCLQSILNDVSNSGHNELKSVQILLQNN